MSDTAQGWQDGNELTERIAALESENVRLKARCKAAEGFVSDIRNFTEGENRRAGIRTALTKYESLEGER